MQRRAHVLTAGAIALNRSRRAVAALFSPTPSPLTSFIVLRRPVYAAFSATTRSAVTRKDLPLMKFQYSPRHSRGVMLQCLAVFGDALAYNTLRDNSMLNNMLRENTMRCNIMLPK
jgi:hypothetical protein